MDVLSIWQKIKIDRNRLFQSFFFNSKPNLKNTKQNSSRPFLFLFLLKLKIFSFIKTFHRKGTINFPYKTEKSNFLKFSKVNNHVGIEYEKLYIKILSIQGVKKVLGRLYIFSEKVLIKKVKVISEVIFNEKSNSDLEFDIEHDFQGHFKVKFIFLNRNPFLSPAIERAKNFTSR